MGGLSSIARRARDLTAGLFCAIGILIALLERDVSGEGHWVQKPPQQAQIFMLDFRAARWLMEKEVADQASNTRPAFKTSDGYINIATTGGRIGERFARSIGAPQLLTDPAYATAPARSENHDALNALIKQLTIQKSTETWVSDLNSASLPYGPIYAIDQLFEDAQVKCSTSRWTCRTPRTAHPPGRSARCENPE